MSEKQDVRQVIGKNLKRVRGKLKYSLQQMADECFLDYAHYCKLEQGKQYVRLDVLQKISDNLGVTIDFWFNQNAKPAAVYNKIIYDNINSLGLEKKEFLLDMLSAYRKKQKNSAG